MQDGHRIFTLAGGREGRTPAAGRLVLRRPSGVATDALGNVFVADSNNHAVRRIDPAGALTTIAGGQGRGYHGDGGRATGAALAHPTDVIVDDDSGDLYIADRENDAVRRVDPAGVITTVVGGNGRGLAGDGGRADQAVLFRPRSIALDNDGTLVFSDRDNNAVRAVDRAGIIHTVLARKGRHDHDQEALQPLACGLRRPRGVAFGRDGSLYVADRNNHAVLVLRLDGTVSVLAGGNGNGYAGDGGPAVHAHLSHPSAIAVDRLGNVFVSEHLNHSVRMIDPAGIITTIAGGHGPGSGGDGGPAVDAQLNYPSGLAIDASDNLIIADRDNHAVRVVERAPANDRAASPPAKTCFVLGCERSGTTALTKLLHGHPGIVMGMERYKYLLRDSCGSGLLLEPEHFLPYRFLDFRSTDTNHLPPTYTGHYRAARRRFRSGSVVYIGDKVIPPSAQLALAVAERFSSSRFVFIVRDPAAVAASFESRARDPHDDWPAENGTEVAVDHWQAAIRTAVALLDAVGTSRVFVVRQEQLYSGDRDVLDALFAFLELAVEPAVEHRYVKQCATWRDRTDRRTPLADDQVAQLWNRLDRNLLDRFAEVSGLPRSQVPYPPAPTRACAVSPAPQRT